MADIKPNTKAEIEIPGFGAPKIKINSVDYAIKYLKANLDDLGQRTELEIIESKGIDGTGDIVIIAKDKFTFMKEYFMVVTYMERKAT